MASTYVAGGDLEYGRYGNPTWTAFEEALGALEGGRCLSFASGLAAVATVLDLVGQGRQGGRPAARLQRHRAAARRPRGPGTAADRAGRRHRHRRRRGRLRGRRPGLAGVAHQPGARGRRHRDHPQGRARGRGLRRRRQHLRHSRCCRSRSTSTSTWSCTPRRSTSPATATSSWARVVTRDDELYAVLKGRRDLLGAVPGTLEAWLALRGLRTLHLRVERAQANAQELVRRLSAHPAVGEVRYPGFGGIVVDRAGPGRAGRRPADPQDRGCGSTPPRSAGSSRPSSAGGAGSPSRRRSPTGWCGSRWASRTSTTCGTTCAGARRPRPEALRTSPGFDALARPRSSVASLAQPA